MKLKQCLHVRRWWKVGLMFDSETSQPQHVSLSLYAWSLDPRDKLNCGNQPNRTETIISDKTIQMQMGFSEITHSHGLGNLLSYFTTLLLKKKHNISFKEFPIHRFGLIGSDWKRKNVPERLKLPAISTMLSSHYTDKRH
jgi:hypothetical protein